MWFSRLSRCPHSSSSSSLFSHWTKVCDGSAFVMSGWLFEWYKQVKAIYLSVWRPESKHASRRERSSLLRARDNNRLLITWSRHRYRNQLTRRLLQLILSLSLTCCSKWHLLSLSLIAVSGSPSWQCLRSVKMITDIPRPPSIIYHCFARQL